MVFNSSKNGKQKERVESGKKGTYYSFFNCFEKFRTELLFSIQYLVDFARKVNWI